MAIANGHLVMAHMVFSSVEGFEPSFNPTMSSKNDQLVSRLPIYKG
jgi:hypothetical protein